MARLAHPFPARQAVIVTNKTEGFFVSAEGEREEADKLGRITTGEKAKPFGEIDISLKFSPHVVFGALQERKTSFTTWLSLPSIFVQPPG